MKKGIDSPQYLEAYRRVFGNLFKWSKSSIIIKPIIMTKEHMDKSTLNILDKNRVLHVVFSRE